MKKTFMGVRLRRLREERGMTQVALARALDLSASYLNQLEQNQRPLTVPVLLKINAVFGVDVQRFSDDDEARLITGLREVLSDLPAGLGGEGAGDAVSLAEIRELAAGMPAVARTLLALHQRHRQALERLEALSAQNAQWGLGDERGAAAAPPLAGGHLPMAYEEVRDFFFARQNHIAELDDAAERCAAEWALQPGRAGEALAQRLLQAHGVRVVSAIDLPGQAQRVFEPGSGVLQLAAGLEPGQRAFQMATQLAFLEMGPPLARLADAAGLSSDQARALARIGLANYFAGALVLPYTAFLRAAEAVRYDIDRLGHQFGVGFETVCHRLSTLQRPGARGVPFFFIRVDRAGNISKRQSATHFHFSKIGGTCPLWNVYEAFAQPGRIVPQIARMPDGRAYLWVARTVSRGGMGWGSPGKEFSVALGCDVRHAPQLVYSQGLDLANPDAAVPIGMGCKVCERPACPQRAFPPIGRALDVNENRSRFAPYPVAATAGAG
ncbi:Cro/Cl family transcriptional regulator [Acidovorax sp. Leaf76]|uniref:short-chain fatty acyl-CoA regulator family protein n=1 Tax=unclassified Acidovorax TaxID=2684926 RepID=UPI0006FDC34C|nr:MULTISPECIES: short-chain fatty acyl-CoA regulator family protein [unclassified Acidovorax]KQO25673.1 Cro/Cl family transcriptional regulator [Acidovorax sp. Leaf76]KQO29355.1 Cro/Cl family transcriptional regulator [Acidovorax sp. Leaf84]KQS25879.1 Cro/Cl family transcriptional regulator [Acidovorax sp. Leaf191]